MARARVPDEMFDQLVASYVLGEILGRGGMGIVYAATQRSLSRAVAVKVPHTELAYDSFVAHRFRIEAMAGARVAHDNVARVIDAGSGDAGAPYIVMERICGRPLDTLHADVGAFETRVALDLCGQILAGLEAAHRARVVHADIKTANVLVETLPDGTLHARVIDFGIAHFLDEPSELDVRLLSGTPDYLAPELIRGGSPSVASDVYAAGVVLYELLTGTTPFAGGTSADIMNRQVDDAVVPPILRCPDQLIPRALEAAVMRALAKAPGDRFASAAEFAAALRGLGTDRVTAPRQFPRGTEPITEFSSEATTRSWRLEPSIVSPSAKGTGSITESTRAVTVALASGDSDMIVTAYLELAAVRLDRRELAIAAAELEHGLAVLRESNRGVRAPMWRLQVCLAALYSGLGDRARANHAALRGREDACRAGSTVGRERANSLIARLSRSHGD